jgi:hypothetical protein
VLSNDCHLVDHPNIPTKHQAKKSNKNAIKNTFFVWNNEKMNAMVEQMRVAGKSNEEVENIQHF